MKYLQLLIVSLLLASPAAAFARIPVVGDADEDTSFLELGGYVQSVSGVQYRTYDLPEPFDDSSGLNSEVIRLEWSGQLTDKVHFEVHNRLFFQTMSGQGALGTGNVVGLGATAQPDRTLDLSTSLIGEDGLIEDRDDAGLLLDHDIDRAAVTVYTDAADITVGRQGITWGRAMIFPVADLWTRFSPFELDQTQKRGTDAVRVLAYPDFSTELDFIVADKGSLEDLSGGARWGKTLDFGDVFVAGGKFWNELIVMAGISATKDHFRGRLEAAEPYDIDEGDFDLPRVTVGGDYIAADMQLSLEYHFNGAGADSPDGYLAQLQSDVFTRGESYFLGRHYVGGLLSYSGFERTNLSLSVISNVGDPSFIVAPNFRYILSDEADINVGAFQGFGEDPEVDLFGGGADVNSEYGTYGGFVFTQLRVFF
ncbi:hypothetical protein FIV42_09475 [Persicimonas caeni]|uniref:Porin n=1 Tax=Persicimonas caeni TaxID=2292766 RepID=A0A4Y6PT50_PERCE|nr:hypothetical protein [Persicimonas caeni]QDG50955.1 hypothetical protein FIV42_09475 [Persicimonas caeni]QED32176.1 hypothetical protein FRD00_09470 [Persicimonas caeni]